MRGNEEIFRLMRSSTLITFILGGTYGALLLAGWYAGVHGPFINSYPFISNDGFDLIFQGHALYRRIMFGENTYLPILRQPTTVAIWCLDRLLSANGLIFFLLNMLAYIGTLLALRHAFFGRLPDRTAGLLLIAFGFLPLHIFGAFPLSEHLGIFLGLLGFISTIKWTETLRESSGNIIWSRRALNMVSLVTFAGVTKTYALMPPLIVLGLALLVLIKERRYRIGGAVLGMIALLGVLHVVLTLSWQRLFDFGHIPSTFSLLRFELGMTSFYLELISYLALYLIPVLVLVAMSIGARLRGVEIGRKGSDNEVSGAWGAYWTPVCATVVTCVQVCFAYFYQWPDSRFTFILMPYLLISLSALVSVISLPMLLMVPLSVYLISFTVAVQPESGFFEPRVSTLKISTRTGWPNMWRSRPVDRFKLKDQCNSSEFCEQVVAPPQQSHYRRSIFEAYVALIKRELRDSIPPASER